MKTLTETFGRVRKVARSRPAQALGYIAAALVVIPGLAYAFPAITGADEAFVVLSGSMVPFFDPGDIIFVDHVPPDSLQVGDIVTFRARPGSTTLITHRVIEVLDAGGNIRYRTQGDANEDPDPFIVQPEMVVGVYSFQIPKWGLLMNVIRSKFGYVAFILLPGSFIVIREFIKLYKELDAADRARQAKKAAAKASESTHSASALDPSQSEAVTTSASGGEIR